MAYRTSLFDSNLNSMTEICLFSLIPYTTTRRTSCVCKGSKITHQRRMLYPFFDVCFFLKFFLTTSTQ